MSTMQAEMDEITPEFLIKEGKKWASLLMETLPIKERLQGMTTEDRLQGLAPEDRLQGLAPEDRLQGLSKKELILLKEKINGKVKGKGKVKSNRNHK